MPASVVFIGGDTLKVEQDPVDAARLLWGHEQGDDAHDIGYAALVVGGEVVYVNPAAVARVEKQRSGTASF